MNEPLTRPGLRSASRVGAVRADTATRRLPATTAEQGDRPAGWPGSGACTVPGASSWLHLLPESQVYPAKARLCAQGSVPREALYLETGLVKLVHGTRDEVETIVGLRQAEAWLGAAEVVRGVEHTTSAVASTTCRLRRVPAECLCALLRDHAAFTWSIANALSQELLEQGAHLSTLACASARRRVELTLWGFCRRAPLASQHEDDCAGFELPLKRWELASLVAVCPEHLSRLLRALQDEGLVQLDKSWIVVRDLERWRQVYG